MELHTIGIDLGKTVFHLVGLNLRGEVVVRKKFSRKQLLHYTANLRAELIGMEACGGAHFLGRALREQGLHRVRERWVMRRTAIINQIRGLLLERGITLRKGRKYVDEALPGILEDATAKLSGALRILLAQLKLELDQMAVRIDEADAVLNQTARENAACQRLIAIPGIGPVTSTALIAAIGNGAAFHKGREFAAWMGIVPREHSTGGKQKLLGISKRGNTYLRTLFIHGARAVLQQRVKQTSGLRAWLAQLSVRSHPNVTVVALANKLARIAWAVLAKNEVYRPLVFMGPAAV